MKFFGKKVEEEVLKNLVEALGKNYYSLTKDWENSQEHLMTSSYFGKVLLNFSEEGFNIKMDVYSNGIYQIADMSRGNEKSYPMIKSKVTSLEGIIPYSKNKIQ